MHTLTIDGISATLHVANFHGTEAVGELFVFDVAFSSEASVSFDQVTGKPAVLTIQSGDATRPIHGIVQRLEHASPIAARVGYRIRLVPSVSALAFRRTTRIFQNQATPDIAKKVFSSAGLVPKATRFALEGSYTPRVYCVQYRETDWDFVMRLFEDDGIHTYFEHSDQGDVLVIADSPNAHEKIAGGGTALFRPDGGALRSSDHVATFVVADEVRPGKTTVRDYDFTKPTLLLEASKSGKSDTNLEVYDFAAGFSDAGAGNGVAERRLDELNLPGRTGRGKGSVPAMIPGATFKLSDHPSDGLEGPWLLMRVEHEGAEAHFEGGGKSDTRYENHFDVVPAATSVRLPRLVAKPRVFGIQTATVIGPSGEEIHVDSYGRIKVMFHWDRTAPGDSNSCWIRVAQPWAGPAYGATFIPRIGHEVIVSFEDGDPDRPLVTSSVYHGANVPPYATPAEKTKSTIKTNSSPGGGGFNELRFEDKKGKEEIFIHAQKDYNAVVLHDESRTIGHDASLDITSDRTKNVGHDETVSIGNNETITIGGNVVEAVNGAAAVEIGQAGSLTVGGAASVQLGQSLTTVVGGAMTLQVQGEVTQSFDKSVTESIEKGKNVTVKESFTLAVHKDSSVAIDGKLTEDIGSDHTVTVATTYALTVGDAKVTVKKNGDIEISGKQITIKGSGPIQISGSKLEVKSDGSVKVQASGSVKVSGGSVDVN